MRVATLQLDFVLGDVQGNMSRADAFISHNKGRLGNLDILVLPELAFSGKRDPSTSRLTNVPSDIG